MTSKETLVIIMEAALNLVEALVGFTSLMIATLSGVMILGAIYSGFLHTDPSMIYIALIFAIVGFTAFCIWKWIRNQGFPRLIGRLIGIDFDQLTGNKS